MNNRIDTCFARLAAEKKKALVTFMTAGTPSLAATEKIVLEMLENGADIVEIGVPFSDPIAEGSVIQAASLDALARGTTLDGIFAIVKSLRTKTDAPLLLMMYVNTIFVYGTEKFFALCKKNGVDGVIVPDLPYEERDELLPTAEKYDVRNINLVSPTSENRIAEISANSRGFLYCVSSLGVTGERSAFSTDFDRFFDNIKTHVACPACVGFGISSPEQARRMAGYCDGVIVGSAVVRTARECRDGDFSPVGALVKTLRNALDTSDCR
ncbi:MAG: tryptophan synthase subunit alpha [Oscillospiraceae bacterium]